MKSFPSTLNESTLMFNLEKGGKSYEKTFDVERLKALNLNTSFPVIEEQLKPTSINASNFQRYPGMSQLYYTDFSDNVKETLNENNGSIWYEDPLHLPASAIALAKDYDWVYKYGVNTILGKHKIKEEDNSKLKMVYASTSSAPSMFNPLYGVNTVGLLRNIPLLNDATDGYDKNIDDCSIRTLCALSKDKNSPLGMERFKYADFMYCKDLGKVSNNHLITLRKFAHPIGDHIGRGASKNYVSDDEENSLEWMIEGDVGRLITWFGTDDNKLEDIAKFTYRATWKELTSQIQEMDSKADSQASGVLGMISNTFNPIYNTSAEKGIYGDHSIFSWLGSRVNILGNLDANAINSNIALEYNYDKNKVYEPRNTIQSNHIYEGKIEFTHEFTLTFSYELRAYDNINPRSAFLDLLGNILEVTGRRGKFWGGQRKLIGPPQDNTMINKVHKFIGGGVDKLSGWVSTVAAGGFSFSDILGSLSNLKAEALNTVKGIINGDSGGVKNAIVNYLTDLNGKFHFTDAIKGMIKRKLGRPQLYAWHSLVSGDDVGLWHVTIGNPKAPILSFGNLIITNSQIQQFGPLGVDDFPSQLKVSITLKHARPRDITDIGRMYTGGMNSLYNVLAAHKLEDFYEDHSSEQTNADNADTNKSKFRYVPINKNEYSYIPLHDDHIAGSSLDKVIDTSSQTASILNGFNTISKLISPSKSSMAANSRYIPSTSNGLLDPSLTSNEEVNLMRKNTWNDKVFEYMRCEVA